MSENYSIFTSPDFDASDYANAVLAGEPYTLPSADRSEPKTPRRTTFQPPKEDLSVVISKLDHGIDDVSKQLKSVVTAHHEELLTQAAGMSQLQGSMKTVRGGLDDLDLSLDKLRTKITNPYQTLQRSVARLSKLQEASEILRRTSRFVILARRLQAQMAEMNNSGTGTNGDTDTQADGRPSLDRRGSLASLSATELEDESEKERTIAKAALSVAELMALIDAKPEPHATDSAAPAEEIPLRSVNAIAAYIPFIEQAKVKITTEMETMVLTGLATTNQALLASSLQTAFNLRVLPDLVNNLVVDLSEAVEERIKTAFDLSRIAKEVLAKEPAPAHQGVLYKSRLRTEPTNLTAPQWTAALWQRLELMIEEMAGCCIKVYTLEKVLKLRKDPVSGVVFLDEAMKVLENKPSSIFWTALSHALEKQAREATKASMFLQQTLTSGYPRLLRLFHDFFAKIAVHTDTVYTHNQQSPETVLVMRALSSFEALYTSRSTNRLNEAVGQAFSGGARNPPSMNEGINVARAIANELDSAKFDPLLVKTIARNVSSSLDIMLNRADSLVVRDRSATTLIGPSATPQQTVNAQVATCLYHCSARLEQLQSEYSDTVFKILVPGIQKVQSAYERIVDPLLSAIRRELAAIIARLHRIDFGQSDPLAGMGGTSPYMKDLVDKLSFIKVEILSKFNVGNASRTWIITIIKDVIRTFVLHVSIAKPLSEGGKLQLTSDMTELEFGLSAFMGDQGAGKRGGNLGDIGDDYRMLRAMRPLLFLDNASLASPEQTKGLPPLVVLHHILVRSPIPLPHTLHGWAEAEYVRWVDEHSDEESLTLIEGGITHWEKTDGEDVGSEDAMEYVRLARTVLSNAKAKP
ncbi:hypothetical protein PUNSTDRAFT_119002 [Punctularia strigosozonata HHB-11173 SS5]|uniref:uncharacterized protein n=1 Tax=Punctularia strigosozonata (strain HHB-11173) TaxID=741275 RepID=UPI00044177BB|nr:uncharacterized protein PUNSTDRAFT_119002 [Punctularia strigosozonata HHB-11173 SS5]EIN11737.1 hypothetical protein PUNSTDRAFT_119002 [Punctularia strigosozonata HHB-11173 SS5]